MPQQSDEGPLKIGTRFLDKYEIQGLLGRGGQACVYRGQHTFTGRDVAIKLIHSPYGVNEEMLVRAKSEARALGRLDHPNVVAMHDAGVTEDGRIYIVMELLRGCSLRGVLATHRRLEVEETLRLAIQTGKAVQAAHEVRMIHRDLKPDNLFVTRYNGLKVLDFGIAKMLDEIGFTTRKDVVIGTMMYMSPEQAQGLPITEQSDIYALGLIMFEALIGKQPSVLIFEQDLIEQGQPYRRPGIADIPPIQVNRIPPLVSDLDREIPIYVAHLVQRSIAKIAKQRFSTMGHFVAAMQLCLDNYLRDVPLAVRRPSGRDLSLREPKVAELLPVSERATAKRPAPEDPESARATSAKAAPDLLVGPHDTEVIKPVPVTREGDGPGSAGPVRSVTPAVNTRLADARSPVAAVPEPEQLPRHSEPGRPRTVSKPLPIVPTANRVQVTPKQAPPASGPFKPATAPPVTVMPRSTASNVARANRIIVRNALVSGSLFGAALSAIAMIHFGPANHSEPQPSGIVTVAPESPASAAAAPPAAPSTAIEDNSAAEPAPQPTASALASAAPSAPGQQRAVAHRRAPLPPKAVSEPFASGLGSDGLKPARSSASATQSGSSVQPAQQRKKAIYGD